MNDVVITRHGWDYVATIDYDQYPEPPYGEYACPVARLEYHYGMVRVELTHGDDSEGLVHALSELGRCYDDVMAVRLFEFYVSLTRGGKVTRDGEYVCWITRGLADKWGCLDVPDPDMSEWLAYVAGDTYSVTVGDETTYGFYGEEYAMEFAREELAALADSHIGTMWQFRGYDMEPRTAELALQEWIDTLEADLSEDDRELLFSETRFDKSAEHNLAALKFASNYYGIDLDGMGYPLPRLIGEE